MKLSWGSIDREQDHFITYLLYKEGKDIELIGKIRNLPIDKVQKQLILAKAQIVASKKDHKSYLDQLLEKSKEQRMNLLTIMTKEDKKRLANEIYIRYSSIDNAEDKMIAIWLIGELKIKKMMHLVYKDMNHPHGNVRRMVCSAVNKAQDEFAIPYLHKALMDIKPQVRQYAAKALGSIGNHQTLVKIEHLLKNPKEKEYVKRAFREAIERIKGRQ